MEFYLVRHGKTDANSIGVKMCGSTQAHLTNEGMLMCINARKDSPFDFGNVSTVICSELERTEETALTMFGDIINRKNLPVLYDKDFNEINFGNYEMVEKSTLPSEILSAWEKSPETLTFPGGDNLKQRADGVYEKLLHICRTAKKPFIIVSSCTLLRLLITKMKNIPLADFHQIKMRNCEIVRVTFDRENETFSFG